MDKKLERILPLVQKPARYTGGEYGEIQKDKSEVDLRMALCFPDTYEIGMSNTGMRILYRVLNDIPGVWCERVFAPWFDMDRQMRENNRQYSFDMNSDLFADLDEYLERELPDNWQYMNRQERKAYITQGVSPAGISTVLLPRRQVCVEEILTEMMDLRKGTKDYQQLAREIVKYMDRAHPEWGYVRHIGNDPIFGRQRGWKRKGVPEDDMDSGII